MIWMRRQSNLDPAKYFRTTFLLHSEQTPVSPGPDLPKLIFIQDVDVVCSRVTSDRIGSEQVFLPIARIASVRRLVRRCGTGIAASRMESTSAATVGRDPVATIASLQQIINCRSWQPVLHCVGDESVTIESAQAVPGAKPKEAFSVSYNPNDESASKTVGGAISPYWQLLSPHKRRNTMQQR